MKENWKDIADYEGLYQVSNLGNVRRITKNGFNNLKLTNGTYLSVDLSQNGEHHRQSIHRLVALHFLPNPKGLKEVNHIDGDKHNNKVSNLEWVSQHENLEHAMFVIKKSPFGKNPRPVEMYDLFTGKPIKKFASISEAGRETNMAYGRVAITRCCQNQTHSAYGYGWRYCD